MFAPFFYEINRVSSGPLFRFFRIALGGSFFDSLNIGFVQFYSLIVREIIWRGEEAVFYKVTKKKSLKVKTALFGNVTDNDCIKKVKNLFVMYYKVVINLDTALQEGVGVTIVQFLEKIKINTNEQL